MSLRLYDGGEVYMVFYDTFQERLDLINKEIFNNPKYNKYYNITDPALSQTSLNAISNRWLGVKIVNRPNKNEHTKTILNFISNYLVNVREHSSKMRIKQYFKVIDEIKKTDNNSNINKLNDDLGKIKNNFLYHKFYADKKDFIFYENLEAEEFINNILNRFQTKIDKTYTNTFMINDLQKRLESIKISKEICLKNKEIIENNQKSKKETLTLLKNEYELLKNESECTENIKKLMDLVEIINKIENENKFYENQIMYLYDDYLYSTEYIVKK